MFDAFIWLAPVALLVVVAILHFVGCELVFVPHGPERQLIRWLQNADGNPIEGPTNQAITIAFPAPVQQGNLIAVWIFYASNAQSVSTVMDSAGNTYQRAVGPTTGQGALAQFRQEIWSARNINPGSGVTVTATFSGTFNEEKAISAHEYQGANLMDPERSAFRSANEANASVGPVSVTSDGLLFAAGIFATGASPGAGFVLRSTLATSNVAQDQLFASSGEHAAVFQNVAQDYVAQAIVITAKNV
jgi:hypothetical protein